jgi:hypothetical protein
MVPPGKSYYFFSIQEKVLHNDNHKSEKIPLVRNQHIKKLFQADEMIHANFCFGERT